MSLLRSHSIGAMLTAPILQGTRVRLEPLSAEHLQGLVAAAAEDRSTYAYTSVPDGVEDTERYVRAALVEQAEGRSIPFAVRLVDGDNVVGSTRFLDLGAFSWPPPWPPGCYPGSVPSDEEPPTVAEIGATWYAASSQRTGVNTECKLLMLAHAFDTWGAVRVTLKTDARNERSRRAIERLGAAFEGVRRAHVPTIDGTIRDTAYYSIMKDEWPAVRVHLEQLFRR